MFDDQNISDVVKDGWYVNAASALAKAPFIEHLKSMSSPFAHLAEVRIKEAIDAGEFDNLAGSGQPLDMDGYFSAPSSLRAGFGFLKSASVVPPEVTAMQEIAGLRQQLESAIGERATLLRKQLQMREVELAMAMERVKRAMKADVVG